MFYIGRFSLFISQPVLLHECKKKEKLSTNQWGSVLVACQLTVVEKKGVRKKKAFSSRSRLNISFGFSRFNIFSRQKQRKILSFFSFLLFLKVRIYISALYTRKKGKCNFLVWIIFVRKIFFVF